MTTHTRKQTRQAIGSAMEGDLVGTNQPAQAFAYHHKTDFEGQSPVITISSAGSDEPPFTPLGSTQVYFYEINTLVMRPNITESATYSESDVEDSLDDLYEAVRVWISQNREDTVNGEWKYISIDARSNIIPIVDDGGRGYFIENIPIRVEVF